MSLLASRLAARRKAILKAWREMAQADPELRTVSSLSRAQFYDHAPEVLEAFEAKLRTRHARQEGAAGHGQHRWQVGYQQREVMREWRHLHVSLLEELEAQFAQTDFDPEVMHAARLELAFLVGDGVSESVAQYSSLQQAEATERVRDLEHTLAELTELEQRRAAGWLEAAHDLRGNVSVLTNASAALGGEVTDGVRARAFGLVQRGVVTLQTLLADIMSLARLEAGEETRHIARFDAGATLRQLCESVRPAAAVKGLLFEAEGPDVLMVEGDAVKTHRIAQNLLLNALAYTERGGIRITWGWGQADASDRWEFCVEDTGPGFEAGPIPTVAHALESATNEDRYVEERVKAAGGASAAPEAAPTLAARPAARTSRLPGAGVGLAIIKRLCELLDATLELETEAGRGTTFRVKLPSAYSPPS